MSDPSATGQIFVGLTLIISLNLSATLTYPNTPDNLIRSPA